MAMTADVKDELSRVPESKVSARKAEVSTILRFAGGLHIVAGRVVVEAELDTGVVARRLRREIGELYGHTPDVQVLAPTGIRKSTRYVVRVVDGGDALARQTGLLDQRGRPGPRPAAADRRRVGRGQRGRLARGVPGPRITDRTRPQCLARDHLPRSGGCAGAGRRGPPDRRRGQGPGGQRRRPGRRAGRRRDRRPAHPARRALLGAGLGGTADAPGGAGHRQPAGQLRRREPATVGAGRGGRVRPGRPGPGDPRARRHRTTCRRPGRCGSPTARRRWRSSASWPTRR